MTAAELFHDLTDVYEALVNWPQRLAREEPFYRRLFAAHQVSARLGRGLRDRTSRGDVSPLGIIGRRC